MKNKATPLIKIFQILLAVLVSLPTIWMLGVSLKPANEPFSSPAQLWPDSMTLQNYRNAIRPEFQIYFTNSIIVSILTVLISVTLGLFGAYGLMQIKSNKIVLILLALIAAQMVPAASIIIPIFSIVKGLSLLNTYTALVIAYIALTLPVATVMMLNFLRGIPREISEAALVDGASPLKAFTKIIIPLSGPGVIATSVWLTVVVWQEFLFALAFTSSKEMRTLPVGLSDFIGQYGIRYGDLMATSIVMSVPVIILFLILQRFFIQGITAGALKG